MLSPLLRRFSSLILCAKDDLDFLLQILEDGKSFIGMPFRHRDLPGIPLGILGQFDPHRIFPGLIPLEHGKGMGRNELDGLRGHMPIAQIRDPAILPRHFYGDHMLAAKVRLFIVAQEIRAGAHQMPVGLRDQVGNIPAGGTDAEAPMHRTHGGHQGEGATPAEFEQGVLLLRWLRTARMYLRGNSMRLDFPMRKSSCVFCTRDLGF
jgi:hypothetical protein